MSARILVVDDLEDNLLLMKFILEAEGYQVELAQGGVEALSKIHNFLPDLILLDVMMPDINGFEVTQQVRRDCKISFIPIVLVTAHGSSGRAEGLNAGADDFVYKPIDFNELLACVRAHLSSRKDLPGDAG